MNDIAQPGTDEYFELMREAALANGWTLLSSVFYRNKVDADFMISCNGNIILADRDQFKATPEWVNTMRGCLVRYGPTVFFRAYAEWPEAENIQSIAGRVLPGRPA
jgi:hypothetical protein